jgi:putative Holliday junction resolvase
MESSLYQWQYWNLGGQPSTLELPQFALVHVCRDSTPAGSRISDRYNEAVNERKGRVLALDLGSRRIGLAISDELGWTAQGLPTLERTNTQTDLAAIASLIREHDVRLVLAGNPLRLSGAESTGSQYAARFAEQLRRRTGVPVRLWDERLTSREAGRVLRSSGISISKRAKAVDRLSAVLLLESYIDHEKAAGRPL